MLISKNIRLYTCLTLRISHQGGVTGRRVVLFSSTCTKTNFSAVGISCNPSGQFERTGEVAPVLEKLSGLHGDTTLTSLYRGPHSNPWQAMQNSSTGLKRCFTSRLALHMTAKRGRRCRRIREQVRLLVCSLFFLSVTFCFICCEFNIVSLTNMQVANDQFKTGVRPRIGVYF